MPIYWTNKEQREWLDAKVSEYLDARARNNTTRFVKSIHAEFSKKWPEREILFPTPTGQEPVELTADEQKQLDEFTLKRFNQLLTWFQRNSLPDGRRSSRKACTTLINKYKKRSRQNQSGEMYGKLYPDRVQVELDKRTAGTSEKPSRGELLNLRRKISAELWELADEEGSEEATRVAEELEKARTAKEESETAQERAETAEKEGEVPSEADTTTLNVRRREFIDGLPDLSKNFLVDVQEECGPNWSFILLAAGPMPGKNGVEDGRVHAFHTYAGATSVAGYDFPDAHPGFNEKISIPFSQFVQDAYDGKLKVATAASSPSPDQGQPQVPDGPGVTPRTERSRSAPALPAPPLSPSGLDRLSEDDEEDDGTHTEQLTTVHIQHHHTSAPTDTPVSSRPEAPTPPLSAPMAQDVQPTQPVVHSPIPLPISHPVSSPVSSQDLGVVAPMVDNPGTGVLNPAVSTHSDALPHLSMTAGTPHPTLSSPTHVIPTAPGGPTEPIEYALNRLSVQSAGVPQNPPIPVDPVLLRMEPSVLRQDLSAPTLEPSAKAAARRAEITKKRLDTRAKNNAKGRKVATDRRDVVAKGKDVQERVLEGEADNQHPQNEQPSPPQPSTVSPPTGTSLAPAAPTGPIVAAEDNPPTQTTAPNQTPEQGSEPQPPRPPRKRRVKATTQPSAPAEVPTSPGDPQPPPTKKRKATPRQPRLAAQSQPQDDTSANPNPHPPAPVHTNTTSGSETTKRPGRERRKPLPADAEIRLAERIRRIDPTPV